MRLSRAITTVLAVAFAAIPVLAQTAPAEAAAPVPITTRVLISMGGLPSGYGKYFAVAGRVEGYNPAYSAWEPLPDGAATVTLDRRLAGTSTWTPIASDAGDAAYSFHPRALANAAYRVRYVATTWTNSGGTTYAFGDSTSATRVKHVTRLLHDRNPYGTRIAGNVDPGWGHRYVTVLRKKCRSCGYRVYRRIVTSGSGAFGITVPAPRHGSYWYRLRVPASTQYIASYSTVYRAYRL